MRLKGLPHLPFLCMPFLVLCSMACQRISDRLFRLWASHHVASPNGGIGFPADYPLWQGQRIEIFAQREGIHQRQRLRRPLDRAEKGSQPWKIE